MLNDIHVLTDHNSSSKEYKAIFTNGEVELMKILDDKNKKVQAYLLKVDLPMEQIQATGDWMQPHWEEHNP